MFYDTYKEKVSNLKKCGWAKAMRESKASYKQEVMIDKPGLSSRHSPSPTLVQETSDNEFTMEVAQWNSEVQKKKVKLSLD